MSKNKKILISLTLIIAISIIGYFTYQYFNKPDYTAIEEAGLNNISGIIESIDKNKLTVLAQVPNKFTPFSEGKYEYVNKRYILKITPTSIVLTHIKGNNFEQVVDTKNIKPNTAFSATTKEDIMSSVELEVIELIIYK